MRWKIPVTLLLFSLSGCATAPPRFVCTRPGRPPVDLAQNRCPLPAREFPFDNLAIEGGGVKGIAYGGALAVLDQARILEKHKLKRVVGTSAGSITAALIALGYTADEVLAILFNLDLEEFKQGGAGGMARLVRHFGWYSGDYYLDWVQCQVQNQTGDPNTTFQELHERNQGLGLPDLYVVTTDLSHSRWRVLSHETVPCMPVAGAVRISGSLPFFWNALRFDLEDFELTSEGCREPAPSPTAGVFSDGGVLLNYPISVFDTAFYVNGGEPDDEEINARTLGLYLQHPPKDQRPALSIKDLPEYARALAESYQHSQVDHFDDSPCDQERSVRIDNLGVKTTDFNLTPAQKQSLVNSGFDHTCKYLQQWRPDRLGEVCGRSPQ